MDELNENHAVQEMKDLFEIMKEMNEDGTDQDTIPNGYGEFGYELTNPIPVNTTYGNTAYFAKLRTMDNTKVSYERLGSMSSPISNHPVDAYKVLANEKAIATLYISSYHKRNSEKAPKNFKLLSAQARPRIRKTSREIFVGLTAMMLLNSMLFLLSKIFTEITLLNCLIFSVINSLCFYFLLLPAIEKYVKK